METMFDDKYYHNEDSHSEDLEDQPDINYNLLNDKTELKTLGNFDE